MDKYLADKNLSLKAKGLMATIKAMPEGMCLSVLYLCDFCNCGRDAVRSSLQELKDNGYLSVEKKHMPSGKFEYEYVIKGE